MPSDIQASNTVEQGQRNFCGIDLLKNKPVDLDHVPRNVPEGIEEWHLTGRGDYYANQALGNDPHEVDSEKKLNEWVSKRADEIDREFREIYNLPSDASKLDVVNEMLKDHDRGGRYCAMSQGLFITDALYDSIQRDTITDDLSQKYRQKF